ncbi:phospho-N-acetylmuramoyl-pentapeptide-transferase [bacterium]|jgi:phospho-N-acetylmuramoyl-pentapeptide-transferase|nr:phospho-N-acetylmuramoyl-pentapeptide-transferase [bacterium]MBT6831888.1 phospho-N-acetylmuramoyl-pentapeptide-transferase [bacterium]MBT6995978.1 phospho-N-acetylmuramoyl-pentapeptide-transferase [bacterium]MBT7772253.1 phospho-N-acetylmuramoyl-pentapeptide-transferase [bacterium]
MKSIHVLNLLQIFFYSCCAFGVATLLFPKFIKFVTEYKLTQKIRENGLSGGTAKLFQALHAHKSGTPTMGGAVIIFAILATVAISRLLSFFGIVETSLLNRGETYLPIVTLAVVGTLGIIDDWLNIREKSKQKGMSAKVKFWSLVGFAVLGALWFALKLEWSVIHLPGIGDFDIGFWYAPLFVFVLVGTANSVNLTDGLDGLAGGLLAIAFGVFAVISYFFGLPILSVFCGVIVATLVAFLWFNVPPAKIYMGDTGSLALGATLGVIAMLTNSVVSLIVIGAIFIVETLSVALQLFWKKRFKRKLFKIAPLHHHFEAKGWSETQIVMRFWIVGALVGIAGILIGLIGMGKAGIL